jgi:predicted DNA-binding protein (MmcQ/YjbR family)
MGKHAPRPSATLERLRALCLSLPGTTERASWGHPNFCVADKIFASYGEYDGRLNVGFKTTKEHQAELVRDPRYLVAPYVGKHGWVCQLVEQKYAWRELEAHVLASYRLIAPRSLLADLDTATRAPAGADLRPHRAKPARAAQASKRPRRR